MATPGGREPVASEGGTGFLARELGKAARRETALQAALPRLYLRPRLSEVDIGYADRYVTPSGLHAAIAALRIGDLLELRRTHDRWELADRSGQTVGRLASVFRVPATFKCIRANVAAIILRRREDTGPAYLSNVRCDEWEVVLPDLILEPSQ